MRNPNPPGLSPFQAPPNRALGPPTAATTNPARPPQPIPYGFPTAAGVPQASQAAGFYQHPQRTVPGFPRDAAPQYGSTAAAGSSQEALVAGYHGDPGGAVPEDFESTEGEYKTLFFEKQVGPFQAWQLFIMWMAITGLAVYIASLIGFRHTGDINGTCDDNTPCRGLAQCLDGYCTCRQPQFVVVEGVCAKKTTEQGGFKVDSENE
ncbi:uncharacterized protein [Dermacentor andersoni]|uniref:uncharacterized protein n=1 Tax=Dermacentor andersoni TaxID=34620 RepID=UPI002416149D|nr:uncharacterized protein LOC129383915 [Dermacentor andersoni]